MLRECSTPQTCHMSHVTCHMSSVTCHVSRVTCHFFIFFIFFLRTKWWSLSVEGLSSTGLPRLVFFFAWPKTFTNSEIYDLYWCQTVYKDRYGCKLKITRKTLIEKQVKFCYCSTHYLYFLHNLNFKLYAWLWSAVNIMPFLHQSIQGSYYQFSAISFVFT